MVSAHDGKRRRDMGWCVWPERKEDWPEEDNTCDICNKPIEGGYRFTFIDQGELAKLGIKKTDQERSKVIHISCLASTPYRRKEYAKE